MPHPVKYLFLNKLFVFVIKNECINGIGCKKIYTSGCVNIINHWKPVGMLMFDKVLWINRN